VGGQNAGAEWHRDLRPESKVTALGSVVIVSYYEDADTSKSAYMDTLIHGVVMAWTYN
jgi:hypothetical protein